jgi:hemerythrin
MTEIAEKPHAFVIEWRDAFNIHLPQIDAEHQHLFHLVAALDHATIGPTIEELLNYVVTHFSHEQQLMEESGYPAFEEHLKLHEQFSVTVADFLGAGSDWDADRVDQLRKFLNRWLIGHIMTHDLRFGNWYRDSRHHVAAQRRPAAPVTPASPRAAAPERKVGWFDRLLGR